MAMRSAMHFNDGGGGGGGLGALFHDYYNTSPPSSNTSSAAPQSQLTLSSKVVTTEYNPFLNSYSDISAPVTLSPTSWRYASNNRKSIER